MSRIKEFLVGDTVKFTWINSGSSPTPAPAVTLYNGSETVVDTVSMTDSGDGHYYAFMTVPDTPGLYVAQSAATVAGYPFKRRAMIKAVLQEVD